MRVMAIDFGDARTGIAVSDSTAAIAGEAWVISVKSLAHAARTIAEEAASRGVSTIVVGHPKNMNGTIGPRALKSEELAGLIEAQCVKLRDDAAVRGVFAGGGFAPDCVKVVLWDERLTTLSAHRVLTDVGKHGKKRKTAIDAVAASLILEGYLDSIR